MDEDENNLDNNSPTVNVEGTREEFDDDDDLLDTIEVTVTTDGAPVLRTEGIEMINLASQPQRQHQEVNSAVLTAVNITVQNNTLGNVENWPWDHEQMNDPILAGNFSEQRTSPNQHQQAENGANNSANANSSPQVNTSENIHTWPWDSEEMDDPIVTGNFSGPSTSNALIRANALFSAMSSSTNAADEAASSRSGGGAVPSYCYDTSFGSRTPKEVAALIVAECSSGGPTPDLNYIMERFFNPSTPIDNPDNISWIRWLIAGGRTISNFVKIGK